MVYNVELAQASVVLRGGRPGACFTCTIAAEQDELCARGASLRRAKCLCPQAL